MNLQVDFRSFHSLSGGSLARRQRQGEGLGTKTALHPFLTVSFIAAVTANAHTHGKACTLATNRKLTSSHPCRPGYSMAFGIINYMDTLRYSAARRVQRPEARITEVGFHKWMRAKPVLQGPSGGGDKRLHLPHGVDGLEKGCHYLISTAPVH